MKKIEEMTEQEIVDFLRETEKRDALDAIDERLARMTKEEIAELGELWFVKAGV